MHACGALHTHGQESETKIYRKREIHGGAHNVYICARREEMLQEWGRKQKDAAMIVDILHERVCVCVCLSFSQNGFTRRSAWNVFFRKVVPSSPLPFYTLLLLLLLLPKLWLLLHFHSELLLKINPPIHNAWMTISPHLQILHTRVVSLSLSVKGVEHRTPLYYLVSSLVMWKNLIINLDVMSIIF